VVGDLRILFTLIYGVYFEDFNLKTSPWKKQLIEVILRRSIISFRILSLTKFSDQFHTTITTTTLHPL